MKIAVTSQNKREITEHAGKCRKFWIYEVTNNNVNQKTLLELPKESSFHESSPDEPHPLDDIQILITGGMGMGLFRRLGMKNIESIVTSEKVPDQAVIAYLAGTLEQSAPHSGHHGHLH